MDKEKIRAELDAFIESGKAKVEVDSGNFVTTHIDMLKIAEHFYEQAEKDFMEKAEKWRSDMNYTSIEQSKKLAELGLNPSDADIHYSRGTTGDFFPHLGHSYNKYDIPCWSVGALLDLMPFPILYMQMIGGGIFWGCKVQFPFDEQKPHIIDGQNSQIDACYNMIVWLCENDLLGNTKE